MKARNKQLNDTLLRCKSGTNVVKQGFLAPRQKQKQEFRKQLNRELG